MDTNQMIGCILAAVSVLLFLLGLVWLFCSKKERSTKRLLILTLAVLFSIVSLKGAQRLWKNPSWIPSGLLIETMQSFSLDADYSNLTDSLEEDMAPDTAEETAAEPAKEVAADEADPKAGLLSSFKAFLPTLWIFYKVLLFTCAPIVGGAVIYDVLAGISPELRLFFLGRRELMVFSELNDRTVLLAGSLVQHKKAFGRFSVVFTDCYSLGDEEGSELIMQAKGMQAVCLQTDLLHCRGLRRSSFCNFFLMDQDASGKLDDKSNLIALKGLLDREHPVWRKRRGCSVTLFTDSPETIENVRALKKSFESPPEIVKMKKKRKDDWEKLEKPWKDELADLEAQLKGVQKPEASDAAKRKTELEAELRVLNRRKDRKWKRQDRKDIASKVNIHVIRDLDMICCRHLDQAPLFDDRSESKKTIDVVIFGQTPFALEMFRSVFWCGQMLDHPLRITVVAPPKKACLTESPVLTELKRSCPELLNSCEPSHRCLSHELPGVEAADIYASLCFVTEDPSRCSMRDFLTKQRSCQYGDQTPFTLADAQRFFVLTGSDEENTALADELRRALVYLKGQGTKQEKKTISVAVENGDLKEVVSKRFESYAQLDTHSDWLKMYPFGSLDDRYSWEVVSCDAENLAAIEEMRLRDRDRHSLPDVGATIDDIYNDWSRVARAYHQRYKMFSAKEQSSGADSEDKTSLAEKKLVYLQKIQEDTGSSLKQDLRWLEHRRWCAFLRSEGFSQPAGLSDKLRESDEQFQNLKSEDKETFDENFYKVYWRYAKKDVPSRLHPCLVEYPRKSQNGKNRDLLDRIDRLRCQLRQEEPPEEENKEVSDTKSYDNPDGEYSPCVTREELSLLWEKLYPNPRPSMNAWLRRNPEIRKALKRNGVYPLDQIRGPVTEESKKGWPEVRQKRIDSRRDARRENRRAALRIARKLFLNKLKQTDKPKAGGNAGGESGEANTGGSANGEVVKNQGGTGKP